MSRKISKIKQAELEIAARNEQIENLENLVRALRITHLETDVVYRAEQMNFAKYKLTEAKTSFAKGMEKNNV